MKYLLSAARGLSAVYKVMLYSWLIYCIVMQVKHRRQVLQNRNFEAPTTRRYLRHDKRR